MLAVTIGENVVPDGSVRSSSNSSSSRRRVGRRSSVCLRLVSMRSQGESRMAVLPTYISVREMRQTWLAATRRLCGAERELAHVHRHALRSEDSASRPTKNVQGNLGFGRGGIFHRRAVPSQEHV